MNKMNAKLAIRIAILTVGLAGAFIAPISQPVPVADGGPILVCPPGDNRCQVNLPATVADGGPILVCPPGDKNCPVNLPLS